MLINAVIRFASLFTKNKVIDRISFVSLSTVRKHIDEANMPAVHGGKESEAAEEWTSGGFGLLLMRFPSFSNFRMPRNLFWNVKQCF